MPPIARLAFLCLAFCAATPTLAAELSPVGQWEVVTGESRYRVSYCGDGHQLCARLTWLRDDARTEKNLALLNREIVSGATPSSDNEWSGSIRYEGETYDGTVRLLDKNAMQVKSCSGVFCRSFELRRL